MRPPIALHVLRRSPALFAVGGLLACPAGAARVAWSLSAWAEAGRYAAQEPASGTPLNREDGTLAGAGLRLALAAAGHGLQVQATRLQGDVAYDGRTQVGVPLRTRSDLQLDRLRLEWAPSMLATEGAAGRWQLSVGLGRQRLDRGIRASANALPLREVLTNTTAGLALAWQAALSGATSLHLRAQLDWPLSQHLRVDSFGVLDVYRLRPGPRLQSGLSLELLHGLDTNWALVLRARIDAGRVGASEPVLVLRDGRPAALSRYPGSRQRASSLALGLERQF